VSEQTSSLSPRTKVLTAVLAFASVAALVLANLSGEWMTAHDDYSSGAFGLRTMQICAADADHACETESNSQFVDEVNAGGGNATSVFVYAGWTATFAMWIAAGALAAAAGLMLAGRFVTRPIALTTIALLALAVGLISGVVFVAEKPSPHLGPGTACFLFAGGELAGIIATILIARIRPPDWDETEAFDEDKW
jgi:hypothetical protein